ncbi:hypothetical protein [Streptomyces scopuliridis]|uniref:hypothetical protein n=1 Tax=Streptomyces scopuliridis TaxID=452529 RepID=UPI00368976AA
MGLTTVGGTAYAAPARNSGDSRDAQETRDSRGAREPASPVGSWTVLITVEGMPEPERGHFSFHADGQLVMHSVSSSGLGTGIGSWRAEGQGFGYVLRSARVDAEGRFLYELRIRQEARLTSRGVFTSRGSGTAVAPDGTVLMERAAEAAGTRFGFND